MTQSTEFTHAGNPSNQPGGNSFVERRATEPQQGPPGVERRQFANSYEELSPEARELARAVDEYKVLHRRRFVTYEELLDVVTSLGYSK